MIKNHDCLNGSLYIYIEFYIYIYDVHFQLMLFLLDYIDPCRAFSFAAPA